MTAMEFRKAIIQYIGYEPGEKVRLKADRYSVDIEVWEAPEKRPTKKQLEKIVSDNKATWEQEQAEKIKEAKRISLKKEIYIREQTGEDSKEFQTELSKLEGK